METILFVDDDEKILKSMYIFFKNKYNVLFANSGEEAKKQIIKNQIDVIVSDYGMLNGDGLELKSFLNKQKIEIPFILVSGQIDKSSSIKFANLKVSYILEKPILFQELDLKIKECIIEEKNKIEKDKMAFVGKNTGQIIHDLNNNLGVISMSSELGLITPECNEFSKKLFVKTKKACENICDLITSYKKLQNTKTISLKEYPIDIFFNQISNEINIFHESNLEFIKNIYIKTNESNSSPLISADLSLIKQVILNLIANSRDSFKENKIKGNIFLEINVFEDSFLISIKDNGPGMPKQIKENIFKEKNSSKGHQGTGMGLAYCKLIIELHLGKISLVNSDETGTEFLIKLPLVKQKEEIC